MKRIAVYYRVSTDDQDFESQKYAVERWLEQQGLAGSDVRVFQDECSGRREKESKRLGYQRLKAAVDAGEVDEVVVYKLDRLSRDAMSMVRLLMSWIERGIGFYSVTQPIFQLGPSQPFRLTMLTIFAEIAQIERETIVHRVNAGLAAAKARGVKLGRRPNKPYNPEDILIMRREGVSINTIAHYLRIDRSTVCRVQKKA